MNQADNALFDSPAAFRQAFEQGLERLLDAGTLNLFILVAANASFEASLFAHLRERLQRQFARHSQRLAAAFRQGDSVGESDDDLLVFLKIACIGFEALAQTESRNAGIWEVQFNHLRAFRPLRSAQGARDSIQVAYDAHAFNFNKPFMAQEALWSGSLQGTQFDLYYNKFPFVDLHCLLVPERQRCLPQLHRREMHRCIWRLLGELSGGLPGIRIGYNALGAYASVNHLHYQLFVRDRPLPLEHAGWTHNGGDFAYPVECRYFSEAEAAWHSIEALHRTNTAYNLMYIPGGVYCLPRRKQGEFPLASWSSGFSWYEMCGGMITFSHADYIALHESQISADLARARLAGSIAR
jgi:hypothetical protein